MRKRDCRVVVFAKAPVPGEVKTRLVPSIDARTAAVLYEEMVSHALRTAVAAAAGPVDLWCAPSAEHPFFVRCSKEFKIKLRAQTEGDLGGRMAQAFSETLKISTCALLIGSDCPCLTQSDLREAASFLQHGVDAVIGPAEDGGYVLLGLSQSTPELFKGVPWGTASVLEETRTRLQSLGWRWHELPERWDVDRPEDLERLMDEGYFDAILRPLL